MLPRAPRNAFSSNITKCWDREGSLGEGGSTLTGPSYALDTSASASGFRYQSRSGTRGSQSPNGREEKRNGSAAFCL